MEIPLLFRCDDARLVGIVARPDVVSPVGVLIVVGGPQYRSGSHRQFTLLARRLAEQGIPSFRFDYRGMGDSEGESRTFEDIGGDLQAALDAFVSNVSGVKRIVIWGLCDAASAALFYAPTDSRVHGLVLLNPWVHTEEGAASARLRHYYLERVLHKSFWIKLISGELRPFIAAGDFIDTARHAIARRFGRSSTMPPGHHQNQLPLIQRMLMGMQLFSGRVLIILSGNDLVSQQFQALIVADPAWREAVQSPKVAQHLLADANHTFSSRLWRDEVCDLTLRWLDTIKTDELT